MAHYMPIVSMCDVKECAFNRNQTCHALVITIDDERTRCAICGIYVKTDRKGGVMDATGRVGACSAQGCKYNTGLECTAYNISVGLHEGHADCKKFSLR
jgi:hypothetical protein